MPPVNTGESGADSLKRITSPPCLPVGKSSESLPLSTLHNYT